METLHSKQKREAQVQEPITTTSLVVVFPVKATRKTGDGLPPSPVRTTQQHQHQLVATENTPRALERVGREGLRIKDGLAARLLGLCCWTLDRAWRCVFQAVCARSTAAETPTLKCNKRHWLTWVIHSRVVGTRRSGMNRDRGNAVHTTVWCVSVEQTDGEGVDV